MAGYSQELLDSLSKPEVLPELRKMSQDVHNGLAALREATESKNADTVRRVEEFFAKYEDLNAKHARKYAAYETAVIESKKRVDQLELLLSQGLANSSGKAPRVATELDQKFHSYLFKNLRDAGGNVFAFRPDLAEYKTLRTDSDVQGGYLIPQVMDSEIRKNITEMSPVRLFAKNRVAMSKTMDIPRRLSIPVATFEGEAEAAQTDQSTYGSEAVTLYRQTVKVPATLDMMVSSAFDLEREIAADVGEGYGKGEGTAFVKGTGQKGPQGFITDPRIEILPTATTGEISWDDVIKLVGKLKRGQNPWLFMNRRTLTSLQLIKSTFGVPIWQPVSGDRPATIWGYPYNSDFIDLDDAQNGSNAKPIVFADLRRGYEIYDMLGISVIRDDLTKADEAITQWIFRRNLTGRVIIPEAFKVLKIA